MSPLSTRLLDRAGALLGGEPASCAASLRYRAAAFLARQALEHLLERLWQRRAPGLEEASVRAQLACLPEFVRDEELVGKVRWAWRELTAACHAGQSAMRDAHQLVSHVELLRALAVDPAIAGGRET